MSAKRIELKDGRVRYRTVVDLGPDPISGKRRQQTLTFDSEAEALAAHTRRADDRKRHFGRHAYSPRRGVTVNEILDDYLGSLTCSEATIRNYVQGLRCVRELIGHRKATSITKEDVDHVADRMSTSGRRRGGRPGSGLSQRSVDHAIGRLRAAYELAILKGKITRRVIPVRPNPGVIVL